MTPHVPDSTPLEQDGPSGPGRRAVCRDAALIGLAAGALGLPAAGAAQAAPAASPSGGRPVRVPLDVRALARQRYGSDADWYAANIPFVDLPDRTILDTYYYRWEAFKKHLRSTADGMLITEFLPSVSWEGANSTISAAVGHHLHEARWLRDRTVVEDTLAWWLGGGGNLRQYTSWIGQAVWADYEVSGDGRVPLAHSAALEADLDAWESHYDADMGLYWIAPVNDATEFTTSGLDVGDGWAGEAFRPTLNSYLFAGHQAVGRIAALAGDTAKAAAHAERAERLRARVQEKLWSPEFRHFTDRFGPQYPDRNGAFVSGPELAGFVPWYFGLPDARYDEAWRRLTDPDAFAGRYGLRTVPPSSPYYMVQHRTPGASPGECEWNGPSWPFQTSQVLTALARLLDERPQAPVGRDDYVGLLRQYAAQQRKDRRPYIAENLDPDTGQWIADFPDRSEHYNHSTFADLVLTGLLGVRPSAGDTLRIRPLVPAGWDHFALQNVSYHGRELSVVYDRDGSHYRLGVRGLCVWVDGHLVASGRPLSGTAVDLRRAPVRRPEELANRAFNHKGEGFPQASASSSGEGTGPEAAVDGRVWFDRAPVNRWVSAPDGARTVEFTVTAAGAVTVDRARIHYYDEGPGSEVRVPVGQRLQYADGDRWREVRVRPGSDRSPAANTATELLFAPVTAQRFRLVLTAGRGCRVALSDLELLGPRGGTAS
ncbi:MULTISPECIES: MGH1-like glycoside hydrolase domain-containing protein [unclassified Streptomyces]|uniref:MGH1-like glycoside hydrolase domain-containing protein n=1 Tax=unclassified Streptomyces TaxID=2593676 RepID=UPI00039C1A8B|nr:MULTISPECIES: discoidin domain-containing protein [unclassified Streptomyces]